MADLLQDLRYAIRVFRKSPGFTAIALLTIALGIGANTAIFTVVNGELLRQVPFPDPQRLYMIHRNVRAPLSYPTYLDLVEQQQSFESVALYRRDNLNLTGSGDAERVSVRMISAGFLKLLGQTPLRGRDFTRDDDRLGAPPVAILTDSFWRSKFGADPGILTKTITMSGESYAVIGIVPQLPKFFASTDAFIPIGQWQEPSFRKRDVTFGSYPIGRLKPGTTQAQLNSDLAAIAGRIAKAYPREASDLRLTAQTFRDYATGDLQPVLLMLFGAVGFVLLIACANIANLLLAKAGSRSREFATRIALGAARSRILRQVFTETVLLAGLGGALGFLLAVWGIRVLVARAPEGSLGTQPIEMDTSVLLFTLGISALAGILFGLLPAWRVSRSDVQETLRRAGRASTGSHQRTQAALIVSEIALAVALLIGAGLMVRSLGIALGVNPGFDPHNALTFSVALSPENAAEPARIRAATTQLEDSIRAVPGVEDAAIAYGNIPLTGDSDILFWRADRPEPAKQRDAPDAVWYGVTPDYLSAMKTPLLRGRFITAQDSETAPRVVVINEQMARVLFPGEDPLGKRLSLRFFDETVEIVGVAGDVKQFGLDEPSDPNGFQFYMPLRQIPDRLLPILSMNSTTIVRSSTPTPDLFRALREKVKSLDSNQVMYAVATMDDLLDSELAFRRFSMVLMSIFAALALVLACVGIYGVISYLVEQRTREIGIRMALGARPVDVLRLVLGTTLLLQLVGVAIGIGIALGAGKVYANMLFGVTPRDPVTFIGVALVLTAVGLLACWIPARRAGRVDPLVALRYE
jgi:predicted permease